MVYSGYDGADINKQQPGNDTEFDQGSNFERNSCRDVTWKEI